MERMKITPKTKKCPIPGCWKHISVTRHLCPACQSWWYRLAMKTAEELAWYLQRMERYGGRLSVTRTEKGGLVLAEARARHRTRRAA